MTGESYTCVCQVKVDSLWLALRPLWARELEIRTTLVRLE